MMARNPQPVPPAPGALAVTLACFRGHRGTVPKSQLWQDVLNGLDESSICRDATELCQLEAVTFLTPEAMKRREQLHESLELHRQSIEPWGPFSSREWRLILGIAVAHQEWIQDTGWAPTEDLAPRFTESPAASLLREPGP